MDYIEEAKGDLQDAINEPEYNEHADWLLRVAQTEALISIAESLEKLADTVSGRALDVHEVK